MMPLLRRLLVLLVKRKDNVLHHGIGDRKICMAWKLGAEQEGIYAVDITFNYIACCDHCLQCMVTLGPK